MVMTKRDEKDEIIRADWSKLTPEQREMIRLYIRSGNKLDSFTRSHYPTDADKMGKSRSTITTACYQTFARPHIKAIIEQIREQSIVKAKLKYDDIVDAAVDDIVDDYNDLDMILADADWVLVRAMKLADFNIRNFISMGADGQPYYDFTRATDDDWYCIQEYVVDAVNTSAEHKGVVPAARIKFKTFDKLRALEIVGRHVKIQAFRDSLELVGNKDKPIRTISKAMTAQEAAEAYKDTLDALK